MIAILAYHTGVALCLSLTEVVCTKYRRACQCALEGWGMHYMGDMDRCGLRARLASSLSGSRPNGLAFIRISRHAC